MDKFHLAQLNIAWMREPLESATMKGFVDNLDRINIASGAGVRFCVAFAI